MPISTRKKNANTHPGRIVLDSQQSRRSKRQIEEDEACAQSAVIAAMDKKAEDHRAITARIAQLEDGIEREESAVRQYSRRPDLRKYPSRPKETATETPQEDQSDEK
jgi:hypothetical protein